MNGFYSIKRELDERLERIAEIRANNKHDQSRELTAEQISGALQRLKSEAFWSQVDNIKIQLAREGADTILYSATPPQNPASSEDRKDKTFLPFLKHWTFHSEFCLAMYRNEIPKILSDFANNSKRKISVFHLSVADWHNVKDWLKKNILPEVIDNMSFNIEYWGVGSTEASEMPNDRGKALYKSINEGAGETTCKMFENNKDLDLRFITYVPVNRSFDANHENDPVGGAVIYSSAPISEEDLNNLVASIHYFVRAYDDQLNRIDLMQQSQHIAESIIMHDRIRTALFGCIAETSHGIGNRQNKLPHIQPKLFCKYYETLKVYMPTEVGLTELFIANRYKQTIRTESEFINAISQDDRFNALGLNFDFQTTEVVTKLGKFIFHPRAFRTLLFAVAEARRSNLKFNKPDYWKTIVNFSGLTNEVNPHFTVELEDPTGNEPFSKTTGHFNAASKLRICFENIVSFLKNSSTVSDRTSDNNNHRSILDTSTALAVLWTAATDLAVYSGNTERHQIIEEDNSMKLTYYVTRAPDTNEN